MKKHLMKKHLHLVFAFLAGLAASAYAGSAGAELLVVHSNSESFTAGQVLSDTDVIKLNKGIWLRLKDQTTRETATLKGPYEGTVIGYRGDCTLFRRLMGRCESDPGRIPIGGTRGRRP